ncbi:MAG: Bifunctional protein GlmU [Promethearchaeota archaeon]|nr:MAG: Bifunctional protein GlmU [Candidatus Lokiarchaeota archaeon]
MHIIFPIAGVGKRLQPFTFSKPKAFIKIAGKRLIDHILIKLKKNFPKGTTIIFIVGYKLRQITDYLTNNYSDYFNIQFKKQTPLGYQDETPYFSGLGDAILLAKELVDNDDIFICLSDRLPMNDYSPLLLNFHQHQCDGIINTKKVEHPQFYGVTIVNREGFITDIVEKPQEFISDLAVSGAYIFSKKVVPRLFKLLEDQNKIELINGQEHQFTPIIKKLLEEGKKIKVNEMTAEILDFGRPESLLEGNRYLLSEVKVENPLYENLIQTNNIIDSKIIPPVFIGKDVKIKDSIIGPNVSIGDECIINRCILSEFVIGDGSHLEKIISKNSILGDYVTLQDVIKEKITIGDQTYIHTHVTREAYNRYD